MVEGVSSNFFVIDVEGNVVTAPDDMVLKGTIRKMVLSICAANHIPVIFQPPNIQNIHEWQDAFVTSKFLAQRESFFFVFSTLISFLRYFKIGFTCTPYQIS